MHNPVVRMEDVSSGLVLRLRINLDFSNADNKADSVAL